MPPNALGNPMTHLLFTIGEVAQLAGVSPKTLRHYHQIGLLAEPARDTNNYRMYSINQLETIQRILRLKELGLSLKQIKIILESDAPDELLNMILQQHQQHLQNEIATLQNRLNNIQDYLTSENSITQPEATDYSAMTILTDTIKPHANGVADVLVEFEGRVLSTIDTLTRDATYEIFWHQAGEEMLPALLKHESAFIFWIERYLALATMAEDDLQAQAWLQELQHSSARPLLVNGLKPVPKDNLIQPQQEQIYKLFFSLLYEQGSPLQQAFLKILIEA